MRVRELLCEGSNGVRLANMQIQMHECKPDPYPFTPCTGTRYRVRLHAKEKIEVITDISRPDPMDRPLLGRHDDL